MKHIIKHVRSDRHAFWNGFWTATIIIVPSYLIYLSMVK
jgi:hypothetical protein